MENLISSLSLHPLLTLLSLHPSSLHFVKAECFSEVASPSLKGLYGAHPWSFSISHPLKSGESTVIKKTKTLSLSFSLSLPPSHTYPSAVTVRSCCACMYLRCYGSNQYVCTSVSRNKFLVNDGALQANLHCCSTSSSSYCAGINTHCTHTYSGTWSFPSSRVTSPWWRHQYQQDELFQKHRLTAFT